MLIGRFTCNLFFILLAAVFHSEANAETISFNVKQLSSGVEFSGHGLSDSCTVTIFGNIKKNDFDSFATRLMSVHLKNHRFSIILSLAMASKIGGTVFVRAESNCGSTRKLSQVKQIRLSRARSSDNNSGTDFLVALRQQSLRSLTKITAAFQTSELFKPVDLQVAHGDNRTFIVEQDGLIKTISPSNRETVFLDISSKVSKGGERGLLGLAFDPEFGSTKRLYINYTDLTGGTVISRLSVNTSEKADVSSEEKLLLFEQPFANHNGGALAFGPDKFLYIAAGDGASGGFPSDNGQNLRTFLGKILRIDVSPNVGYSIPSSNPYFQNLDSYREEIFAYGLRNPWRISFDGRNLYAGELGQNTTDEIDLIKKGGNYGWKIKEGSSCFEGTVCSSQGLIDPISEDGRDIGTSITGGYVSREVVSPNLNGVYIFGDFINGRVFALEKISEKWVRTEIADTNHSISSFGRGKNQEIFFLSYLDGKVFRVLQK